MSAHTEGPWVVGDLDQAGQRIVRQQHIEICTCWHHGVMSIEREMEANARLIAAAPEMLEALKRIASSLDIESYPRPCLERTLGDEAIAAIAKAEGRS